MACHNDQATDGLHGLLLLDVMFVLPAPDALSRWLMSPLQAMRAC